MKYKILSTDQIILADYDFVNTHYPNDFELVVDPVIEINEPYEWFIDIGPFFDRFGATKMAILTSTDAGVKAILADIQVRKWIDLKRADVASALDYIMTKVPSVTDATKSYVLDTPVTAEENLALRKLYF